jgi:hypothetical protein
MNRFAFGRLRLVAHGPRNSLGGEPRSERLMWSDLFSAEMNRLLRSTAA